MTTIAYKDGIIAYDSRIKSGDLISDDDFEKKEERDGVVFIMAGTVADYTSFIDSYFAGKNTTDLILNICAIIIDNGQLYEASMSDDKMLWKCIKRTDIPYACGTGEKHAFTAMDMGATAEEAVQMAIKRDVNTGGKVRTYKIKEKKNG